ncbi:FCD domain-containing protein, partial [Rubrobacter calidifluminis]
EEQLEALKGVLDDMRRAAASQSNPRELARLNLDFHRVIGEASEASGAGR